MTVVVSDPFTVRVKVIVPTRGALQFDRFYDTNVGLPAGSSCFFGKHTQWAYCPADGRVWAYGGDGDWRLAACNFVQQQALNSAIAYNFSPAAGGAAEVVTK